MAKISHLPTQAVINGFKGVIDYYLWMGIPCVRSWPRSPGHERAPLVQAQWPTFTAASQLWKSLSPSVREAYRQMSVSTNMTPRDIFTKSYINGNFIRVFDV